MIFPKLEERHPWAWIRRRFLTKKFLEVPLLWLLRRQNADLLRIAKLTYALAECNAHSENFDFSRDGEYIAEPIINIDIDISKHQPAVFHARWSYAGFRQPTASNVMQPDYDDDGSKLSRSSTLLYYVVAHYNFEEKHW